MKNRIILIAAFLIAIFGVSVYGVDKKYIPQDSEAVFSFNLNTLSQKAEVDLQEVFNKVFMQRLADNFLEYRDDQIVAEIMTNGITNLFDFSKYSKAILFNGYREISIIVDVLDITELDKLMIKIASQEDKLISIDEEAYYRYLYLDEDTLITWNNEIFNVTLRLKDFYWYRDEEEPKDLINVSRLIFADNTLTNEKFVELENATNDFYAWIDLDALVSNNGLVGLLLENGFEYKDIYEDGVLTCKINFNSGDADMILDTYMPNSTLNLSSIKKPLSENIYNFVNGENNYGFISFAFNSSALANILKETFGEPLFAEILQLDWLEIDASALLGLLGGDIFVSAWDTPDYETTVFVSLSVTNEEILKTVLENLAESVNDNVYIIDGNYCYVKDSILYIANDSRAIESVSAGRAPTVKLDENKLKLAKENTFSLYLEFNTDLWLFDLVALEPFESLYLTSNVIDDKHSQTAIKLNMRDKTKNSLTDIIKTFIE